MKHTILIIDDEDNIRFALQGALEDEGFDTILAPNGEEGLNMAKKHNVDLVLLDIWMPGMDGLTVLEKLKSEYRDLPVIIMTGHGSIETAIKATRLGALDFIEKPLDLNKIIISINNAMHLKALEDENALLKTKTQKDDEMVGSSRAIQQLKEAVDRAAASDAWVMILGENGSGKELVARRLHKFSQRKSKPFVEVNCAAIPEELIESELMGHEKGAFTGATDRKRGKFDLANQGTLFLDEIGDMSLNTQAKILRVLQEQRFQRVGGSQVIQVDVRVFTATNKNLEQEILDGNFRQDLYYRLNVIPINVPPLRERKEDIPALAQHFMDQLIPIKEKKKSFSDDAINRLMEHDWPGNVREFKNIIERLVIMSPDDTIKASDMIPLGRIKDGQEMGSFLAIDQFKDARTEFERMFIAAKLGQCDGNISKTADLIGVERSNLHRKIKSLGIDVG